MNASILELSTSKIILEPAAKDGLLRREDVSMFEVIFQHLLDVYFYVKDIDGRWVSCNTASLDLLNISRVSQIIGQTEDDFFPERIATDIRADDLTILNTAKSVIERTELITNNFAELIWVTTTKVPIFNKSNKVVGIMGVTRPFSQQKEPPKLFSKTIEFIRNNLSRTIKIADLSQACNMSESQFRRKFRAEFGLSPQEFILRARLQIAAHLLRGEESNISQVATLSGFSDQSYFTRQFKRFFGETPKVYLKSWQATQAT